MNWDRFNELISLGESGQEEAANVGLRQMLGPSETPEDNANILMIIGANEKAIGQYDRARKTFAESCAMVGPDSWIRARVLHFEASIDIIHGEWKEALAKLDKIEEDFALLLQKPEDQDLSEEVRRKRGMALYELDKPREALPLLQAAVRVEYERPISLYYLGRCCYELSDLRAAKDALTKALALDIEPSYQPSSHYIIGLSCHWLGEYAWAVREFEWCLEHDPNGRVAKRKVLTALINSFKALGMDSEVNHYTDIMNDCRSSPSVLPKRDNRPTAT